MQLISTDTHIGFDVLTAMYLLQKEMPQSILDLTATMSQPVYQFINDHKSLWPNAFFNKTNATYKYQVCLTTNAFHDNDKIKHGELLRDQTVKYVYPCMTGSFALKYIHNWYHSSRPISLMEASLMQLAIYEITHFMSNEYATEDVFQIIKWLRAKGARQDKVSKYFSLGALGYQSMMDAYLLQCETVLIQNRVVIFCTGRMLCSLEIHCRVIRAIQALLSPSCFISLFSIDRRVLIDIYAPTKCIDAGEACKDWGGYGDEDKASVWVDHLPIEALKNEIIQRLKEALSPRITAKTLMTTPVLAANQYDTVREVFTKMRQQSVSWMPIVSDNMDFIGSISFRSLAQALSLHLDEMNVMQFMQDTIPAIHMNMPIHDIKHFIKAKMVTKLVVQDDEHHVIGVITLKDLFYKEKTLLDLKGNRNKTSELNFTYIIKHHLSLTLQNFFYWCRYTADKVNASCYLTGDFLLDLICERPFTNDIDLLISDHFGEFAQAMRSVFKDKIFIYDEEMRFEILLDDQYCINCSAIEKPYLFMRETETACLQQALYRQGFSITSLAVQLNAQNYGQLIDSYAGYRDLKQGYLRSLTPLAFVENPVLMIEAIRLEQKYHFKMTDKTWQTFELALTQQVLTTVSPKSLRKTILKCLSESCAVSCVLRFWELGMLAKIIPGIIISEKKEESLQRFSQLQSWCLNQGTSQAHLTLVLLALLIDDNSQYLSLKLRKWILLEELQSIRFIGAKGHGLLHMIESNENYHVDQWIKNLKDMPIEVLIFTLCKVNDKVGYTFALNYLHLSKYQNPDDNMHACLETCAILVMMMQRKINASDLKRFEAHFDEQSNHLGVAEQKVDSKWVALSQDLQIPT